MPVLLHNVHTRGNPKARIGSSGRPRGMGTDPITALARGGFLLTKQSKRDKNVGEGFGMGWSGATVKRTANRIGDFS